jgi:hypothetical protein
MRASERFSQITRMAGIRPGHRSVLLGCSMHWPEHCRIEIRFGYRSARVLSFIPMSARFGLVAIGVAW